MPERTLSACRLAALAAALLCVTVLPVWGQANFQPLERDDYTEVDQQIIALKGLEAHVDYGLTLRKQTWKGYTGGETPTELLQDARLHLRTLLHQDVSLHLSIAPGGQDLTDGRLREDGTDQPPPDGGGATDAQPLGLELREAYLRWSFNPNSAIVMGKHELSLGDRRGKVFHALVPGLTFDCEVGTWCMPFGAAYVGPRRGDTVYHWALQYNAWDARRQTFPERLNVEIFRIVYNEANVPLGENLGPTTYDPDAPSTPGAGPDPLPGQRTQATGEALYYDVRKMDYYGVRLNWDAGRFFVDADITASRGTRDYHLYRDPETGIVGNLSVGVKKANLPVSGEAFEANVGWRWDTGRMGVRFMNATGDEYVDPSKPKSYLRGQDGYHEIAPGSYKGTRLYFNGAGFDVADGDGLGHSVNNTRVVGFFLDYEDRESRRLGYSLGLYKLSLNNGIPDVDGKLQTDIGVEVDNRLTWFVHKALNFQFEANLIEPGGAFRLNDYGRPGNQTDLYVQALFRLVYQF